MYVWILGMSKLLFYGLYELLCYWIMPTTRFSKVFHHKFRDDICQPSIAKIQKQPKWPSTDEWMQNSWYIYIYIYIYIYTMEYYSAIKKNEILPRVMLRMKLESILLSEVRHTEKDKCRMFSLICWIQKIKQMSKQKK